MVDQYMPHEEDKPPAPSLATFQWFYDKARPQCEESFAEMTRRGTPMAPDMSVEVLQCVSTIVSFASFLGLMSPSVASAFADDWMDREASDGMQSYIQEILKEVVTDPDMTPEQVEAAVKARLEEAGIDSLIPHAFKFAPKPRTVSL